MNEMIEQVAKAICRSRRGYPCYDGAPHTCYCGYGEENMALARAAIEVMREPTAEMIGAAENEDDPGFCDEPGHSASVETHWRAMIDEALK